MKIRKNVIRTAVGAALAGAALVVTAPAQACGNDGTLGAICMTAASYCPRNTIDTSGQLLPISQYAALYSLLGTNYGGDGRTTFGVPDLRGRTAVGFGTGPGLAPVIMGQKRGQEVINQASVTVSGAEKGESVARDQPKSNIPPQLGVRFCIYSEGMYPSRN